jgi:hypothetical protein
MTPTLDALQQLRSRCYDLCLLMSGKNLVERCRELLENPFTTGVEHAALHRAMVEGSFVELTVWIGDPTVTRRVVHWDLQIACAQMLELLDKEFSR